MDKLHITSTHRGKSHNELGKRVSSLQNSGHYAKPEQFNSKKEFKVLQPSIKNFVNCSLSRIYYSSDGISISMVNASLGTFQVSKP